MKKNLSIFIVSMALVVALNACSTIVPGKIIYSEDIIKNIEDMNAVANILVTEEGTLLFYDSKGEALEACKLPKHKDSYGKKRKIKTHEDTLPVCQGMETGSAVISIQTLPILQTNSTNCMTFGPDASGGHHQLCW